MFKGGDTCYPKRVIILRSCKALWKLLQSDQGSNVIVWACYRKEFWGVILNFPQDFTREEKIWSRAKLPGGSLEWVRERQTYRKIIRTLFCGTTIKAWGDVPAGSIRYDFPNFPHLPHFPSTSHRVLWHPQSLLLLSLSPFASHYQRPEWKGLKTWGFRQHASIIYISYQFWFSGPTAYESISWFFATTLFKRSRWNVRGDGGDKGVIKFADFYETEVWHVEKVTRLSMNLSPPGKINEE